MRTIKIGNVKLRQLLEEKDPLVKEARKISGAIDIIDLKINKNKDKQRKYTLECEPKELIEKGNALAKTIEANLTELENLQKEIHALKVKNIPQEIGDEYEALKKQKEEKEIERNKLALKVQKIKDKATPMIQKEAKKHLEEFEDIDTAVVKNGVVEVNVFSHLEDFKSKFREKNAKKS